MIHISSHTFFNLHLKLCKQILAEEGDTKIIVFTDGRIGAGEVAREFLMNEEGLGCTWLDGDDTVEVKNKKLGES